VQPPCSVADAVEALRRGDVVALPTETVYGLGADASNPSAVKKIFALKGRPADHPLIVHLYDAAQLPRWAEVIPHTAMQLGAAFWPGPLTLILKKTKSVPLEVTGGLETVGLRVPSHPLAREVLQKFSGGVAAPSANRFGRVSPTTAAHVREEFGAELPLILDGGACDVGVESTIVDLSSEAPAILRPGGITQQQIEEVLKRPVPFRAAGTVRAPGTLAAHYAPHAKVVLCPLSEVASRVETLRARELQVAVLSWERPVTDARYDFVELPSNAEGLARGLYAALREADRRESDAAVVALPEGEGINAAVRDRLMRAAAASENGNEHGR
jgi:L-threonylcarbamoyladenylate synthase